MTPTTPQALSDERQWPPLPHLEQSQYDSWEMRCYAKAYARAVVAAIASHEEAAAAREPSPAPAEREGCKYVVAAGKLCPKCGYRHESALAAAPLRMAAPVALRCCEKHQGQPFTIKATYTPPARQVCPLCEPDWQQPVRSLGVIETAKEGKRCKECTTPNGCKLDGCMRDLYGYRSTPPAASQPEEGKS